MDTQINTLEEAKEYLQKHWIFSDVQYHSYPVSSIVEIDKMRTAYAANHILLHMQKHCTLVLRCLVSNSSTFDKPPFVKWVIDLLKMAEVLGVRLPECKKATHLLRKGYSLRCMIHLSKIAAMCEEFDHSGELGMEEAKAAVLDLWVDFNDWLLDENFLWRIGDFLQDIPKHAKTT